MIALCAVLGYLLGSLNFAVIISCLLPKGDVRNMGSGNAGATNMLRSVGKIPALLTALGDSAKCAVAVFVGSALMGDALGALVAGSFCLVGHCYPLYFGLRGGKGVITTAILALFLSPISALIGIASFAIVYLATRYVSLGSVVAMVVFAVANAWFHWENGLYVLWGICIASFVIFRHRENLIRLWHREETKTNY